MKILWLVNIMLPEIAEALKVSAPPTGGWLTGLSKDLVKRDKTELIICFPADKTYEGKSHSGLIYYGFDQMGNVPLQLQKVINRTTPDVVHIWGTELKQSRIMLEVIEKLGLLDNALLSIQGLVSIYAKHYYANLPNRIIYSWTLRDLIKCSNIWCEKRIFEKRGKDEIITIQKAKHIIGRTDWDRACTYRLNPGANYYFCNETLRESFYKKKWKLSKCERHSIFVSQCSSPIKGFHYMLEALVDIKKRFPDTHLYTTGRKIVGVSFKEKLKQTSYEKHIVSLIKKYNLEKNVTFLGVLDEEEMCERYIKSNVFVSCSAIENSPNSLGEAMLVGCPSVSSDVGGVKNMLRHGIDGYIYPSDEPYMLAYYISKIFLDDDLAIFLSENGKEHAKITHDNIKNCDKLVSIYEKVKK